VGVEGCQRQALDLVGTSFGKPQRVRGWVGTETPEWVISFLAVQSGGCALPIESVSFLLLRGSQVGRYASLREGIVK
jgi:hypothetical protein